MGQRTLAVGHEEPRTDALTRSVDRLRRALDAHPARLPDRQTAEEELALLASMARGGAPDVLRLRRSLLVVASALGSVSALAAPLAELRRETEAACDAARADA
ncbi:DUF5955 family protein [Streptomyces sp. Z26]|uniref:DUF5955 family protein n=1 Tax=Streptomyces TaxID=1883 RepID=UPI001F0C26A1|nr:DUF5955 family protein [Streptomyces sp. Z26]